MLRGQRTAFIVVTHEQINHFTPPVLCVCVRKLMIIPLKVAVPKKKDKNKLANNNRSMNNHNNSL